MMCGMEKATGYAQHFYQKPNPKTITNWLKSIKPLFIIIIIGYTYLLYLTLHSFVNAGTIANDGNTNSTLSDDSLGRSSWQIDGDCQTDGQKDNMIDFFLSSFLLEL